MSQKNFFEEYLDDIYPPQHNLLRPTPPARPRSRPRRRVLLNEWMKDRDVISRSQDFCHVDSVTVNLHSDPIACRDVIEVLVPAINVSQSIDRFALLMSRNQPNLIDDILRRLARKIADDLEKQLLLTFGPIASELKKLK